MGRAGPQASGVGLVCCLRWWLPESYLPAESSVASSAARGGRTHSEFQHFFNCHDLELLEHQFINYLLTVG